MSRSRLPTPRTVQHVKLKPRGKRYDAKPSPTGAFAMGRSGVQLQGNTHTKDCAEVTNRFEGPIVPYLGGGLLVYFGGSSGSRMGDGLDADHSELPATPKAAQKNGCGNARSITL